MDQLLQMIQSADPTDNQSDSVELLQLEGKDSPVCIPYFNVPIMFLSSSHQLFLYLFVFGTASYCDFDPTRGLQSDGPSH